MLLPEIVLVDRFSRAAMFRFLEIAVILPVERSITLPYRTCKLLVEGLPEDAVRLRKRIVPHHLLARSCTQSPPQLGGAEDTENGIGHLGWIGADQKSSLIVQDELLRTAATGRDDGATACHRFKCRDAKPFLMRRNYKQIKSAQLVAQRLNWDIAAEFDGIADAEFLYPTSQPSDPARRQSKARSPRDRLGEVVQGTQQQLQILARIAKPSREADASRQAAVSGAGLKKSVSIGIGSTSLTTGAPAMSSSRRRV